MKRAIQSLGSLVALLAAVAALAVGCHTTKSEPEDDPAASLREMRKEVIQQMKEAGASASQIRATEQQFDEMERQARATRKQMERLEKQSE